MDRFDEVVIEDHGGGTPRRLRVASVQASWTINEPGEFSCFARIDDLRSAGLGWDLQDRWVTWYGPAGLTFGGVITGRPVEDGVAEIEAQGWARLLEGHLLTEFERVPEGGPGGLARRAVIAGGTTGPTYINIGMIDEGGVPISVTFGGADVLDVLSDLTTDDDIEWTIDATRTFHAARRLGRDKSARIRLVEDRQITNYRIAEDAWAAPPDEVWSFETLEDTARRRYLNQWGSMSGLDPQIGLIAAVPGSALNTDTTPGGKKKSKRRRKKGKKQNLGQKQNKRAKGRGGGGRQAVMTPPPPHWALSPRGVGANQPGVPAGHTLHLPTTPLEITIANVDNVWSALDLGDTVRVELGTPGFAGRFRIMTMALDASEGELHLAGEALEDD